MPDFRNMVGALVLAFTGCLMAPTEGSEAWKFLRQYPKHQVVGMLANDQTINADGIPDERAWALTNWTDYQWVRSLPNNSYFLSILHVLSSKYIRQIHRAFVLPPNMQVDITRHNDSSLNRVFPPFNLLRLKTLWSEHTLYIAAQLREPFVYGTVSGHNTPTPPYKVSVAIVCTYATWPYTVDETNT